MKYVIFAAVVCLIITAYHWIEYKKTGYNDFEYYLIGETNPFIKGICLITLFSFIISLIGAIIFGGGYLIGLIFNI